MFQLLFLFEILFMDPFQDNKQTPGTHSYLLKKYVGTCPYFVLQHIIPSSCDEQRRTTSKLRDFVTS